ncbi:Surface presentation of antigens protein spaS [Serratia quinivorans]|uniref:EscU/YscU/HrcU family type III secretion system export apparatus switch protein n=1 Tax=Serratia quinivorans TaxID=137545 RepID=UPI00217B58E3|nr:EscU/YscU/HrcU family type III secretion system export apparatus switch protein [Serratia quinivorans]CAI1903624.1 Surface presentation of antigens protein spaS [Serratia quinivorans]
MAEKTEKPTDKKFRDSAKKGQSFKGKDLIAAAVVSCGILAVSSFSSLRGLGELLKKVLLSPSNIKVSAYFDDLYSLFLFSVMPVLLSCLLPGILLALLQSRFRLATEAIKINFSHLNPISGLKKIFGLRPLKELVKALLYLIVFSFSVYWFFILWRTDIFMLYRASIEGVIQQWGRLCVIFVFFFLGVALILLLMDTLAELFLFIKELKMEKQEVKKEHKDNEGDPQMKRSRKEIHMEMISEEVKTNVRNSSFVLANPTHVAIGIYLDLEKVPLPFVSVRESNIRARTVIAYAEKVGIPVVRNAPLARRIYRSNQRYTFVREDELVEVMDIYLWLRLLEMEKLGIKPEPFIPLPSVEPVVLSENDDDDYPMPDELLAAADRHRLNGTDVERSGEVEEQKPQS